MVPIYLGCLSTLTLFISFSSLGMWGMLPSPARWCLGIQGLGKRVNSALHPVLISENSWLFLPPDSSRGSADISFLLLPLLGGQPSLSGEAAAEREPHSSQTPVADAVQVHLILLGGSFTSLRQHLVFAAFLLLIPALVPSGMGFPSFTCSAAVADWLCIL